MPCIDETIPDAGPGSVIRWLADNGISVKDSGDIDEQALHAALAAQLGERVDGFASLAPWARVALTCIRMHAAGDFSGCASLRRDAFALTVASWRGPPGRALMERALMGWPESQFAGEDGNAHAFQTTLVLDKVSRRLVAAPLFARQLSWLAVPHPGLWAAVNGAMEANQRCAGLGIAAHHAAERFLNFPLVDPNVDEAVEAIVLFVDRLGPDAVRRAMEACPPFPPS